MPANIEKRVRNLEILVANIYDQKNSIWRDSTLEQVLQELQEESAKSQVRKEQEL